MATSIIHRPVAGRVRPVPVLTPTPAVRPAPTVLRAFEWEASFGPWPQGVNNIRPVVEAAMARARARAVHQAINP